MISQFCKLRSSFVLDSPGPLQLLTSWLALAFVIWGLCAMAQEGSGAWIWLQQTHWPVRATAFLAAMTTGPWAVFCTVRSRPASNR